MKLAAILLLLGCVAAPSLARAQSAEEPSLAFTISAGVNAGSDLWQINKQVLRNHDTLGNLYQDTATITRRLRPGISAMLGVTYQRSPHLGLHAEIAYYGLGTEQDCRGPAIYQADSAQFNKAVCDATKGQHIGSNIIDFQVGALYRVVSGQRVSPYFRAAIGAGFLGNSFVETTAFVASTRCGTIDELCEVKIITERNSHTFTYSGLLAFGLSIPMGTGYRFNFEGRDLVTALPVIDKPALIGFSGQPVSQSHLAVKNVPIFVFGLDVLLERTHPRRY